MAAQLHLLHFSTSGEVLTEVNSLSVIFSTTPFKIARETVPYAVN